MIREALAVLCTFKFFFFFFVCACWQRSTMKLVILALVALFILPTIEVSQIKSYAKVNVGKTCNEMQFLDADENICEDCK